MKLYLPTIVAIITGVIALLTYFFPVSILGIVRQWMLSWAMLLAAVALLVGVVGLVRVHVETTLEDYQRRYEQLTGHRYPLPGCQ